MNMHGRIFHNKFIPVSTPEFIQMDITNKCNLKCIYCNVQGDYNLEKGNMDISIAEQFFKELKHIGWNIAVREFRPFINGDALMLSSNELNEFLLLGKKYLDRSKNVLYTNGADSSKSRMFLTPLLDEIHITCSASMPETYRKIHGVSLLNEVIETYNMLINNGKDTYIHFIYNKYNENELDDWKKIFNKAKLMISPLHYSDEQTTSYRIFDASNMKKGYEIGNTASPKKLYFFHPCNCWNNLSISWKGEYMQCPDVHYKYNYGRVGEISIKQAWKNRLDDRLKSNGCKDCNLKRDNYEWRTYISSKWVKMF